MKIDSPVKPSYSTWVASQEPLNRVGELENSQGTYRTTLRTEGLRPPEAVFNERLDKTDLSAGDILLLVDQPQNTNLTHQLIKLGQRLPALSPLRRNNGDCELVHAVMWSKRPNNAAKLDVNGAGESEIVEMRGGTKRSSSSSAVRQGLYKVYSPKDKNLGDWAAQVGQVWSVEGGIPYSKPHTILSIVRNSGFKTAAKAASAQYASQAFENRPRFPSKGSFCSHFVLAAYQAAAKNMGIELTGALKVDAQGTSVRTLEHFLKEDKQGFEFKGYLKIESKDALYQE
ncbi:hypothetical protein [Pseudomonas sp. MWU15-20650]|uniref:hypothetical protein n=1 Tax=Pseudomonas sp. MWU15-20650 TaxID=2933107 RepID=UPI002010C4F4|nr:hypothetical protein [Pseudomonas sp. MWU15-20650]